MKKLVIWVLHVNNVNLSGESTPRSLHNDLVEKLVCFDYKQSYFVGMAVSVIL